MHAKTALKTHSTPVRLNEEFYRRLRVKLAAEGTTFQSKVQALLEDYLDGPAASRDEIQRQVAAARAAMRRYAPAMRELAR
jgi:hypothetical protein